MHLGNGAITPECAVVTWGLAASGVAWSARQLLVQPQRTTRRWLAAGAVGAGLLAAQMANVLVLPGISGHLLGGVLAACLLGPELAVLVMASVLAIQAVCFGDGGLVAWGANLLNMGILPAGLVALTGIRPLVDGREDVAPRATGSWRWLARAGLLATASVMLAAAALVVQVGFGRAPAELSQLPAFAATMFQSHLVIGLLEGAATATFLGLLALGRVSSAGLNRRVAWAGAVATLLLLLSLPWTSSLPDGYEAAAASSGFEQLMTQQPEVLAEVGQLNGRAAALQQSWQSQLRETLGEGWASMLLAVGLAALLPAGAVGMAGLWQQRRRAAAR